MQSADFTVTAADACVFGAIVVEGPAERCRIKTLGLSKVFNSELDIVNRMMVVHLFDRLRSPSSSLLRRPALQRPFEYDNLPGMIKVMLRKANKLRVRRVWRLRHQWFIETVRVEAKDRLPDFAV
jgi:hypothetical protein